MEVCRRMTWSRTGDGTVPGDDLQSRIDAESGQRPKTLTEADVFEILSNQRRRFVFHYLKQRDREVYLRELAEHVAAWECDKPVAALESGEKKRVKTALHQHHLPKMDETGFLEYDRMRETVTIGEEAADLEVYLDVVPKADVPWSRYYLGLAGAGAGLIAAKWLNLVPASMPETSCAAFLVAALLVSASVHTYFNRSRLRLGGTDRPPEIDG
jgi:hypothetical protein